MVCDVSRKKLNIQVDVVNIILLKNGNIIIVWKVLGGIQQIITYLCFEPDFEDGYLFDKWNFYL